MAILTVGALEIEEDMGDTAYNILLFVSEVWHHSIRNLLVYNVRVCV